MRYSNGLLCGVFFLGLCLPFAFSETEQSISGFATCDCGIFLHAEFRIFLILFFSLTSFIVFNMIYVCVGIEGFVFMVVRFFFGRIDFFSWI